MTPASRPARRGFAADLRRRAFALLLPVLAALLPVGAQDREPVENLDYVVIADGQPWEPLAGQVEVVEVFSYACVHCFHFERPLAAWRATQLQDVRVTPVPAAFAAADPFARGFFAAQAMGLAARTHRALFAAVHETGRLPRSGASPGAVADVYAEHGAGPQAAFLARMASPATDARLNAARAFAVRSGVEGTPTLIINGRYRVTARTPEDALAIAGWLVARERARR
nr:thiol:disulfide interchange protein DsbA/DsbL [Luteimonas deserti]